MTEADLDRRYFGSGPVIVYNPATVALRLMAPPPVEAVKLPPISHRIGVQPQPKSPRIARSRRRHGVATSEKPRRFPHAQENCSHAAVVRNGKGKIRCSGCGTVRQLEEPEILKLLAREIPMPRATNRDGRPQLPDECGTYRTYRRGCRCKECVGVKRAASNASYARKVGKLPPLVKI